MNNKPTKERIYYNPKLFSGGLDFSPESIRRTDYQLRIRATGRYYAQMHQIIYYLKTQPEKSITVVLYDKQKKKEFLKFAKDHHVFFGTTRIKKWENAWQYTIKSVEIRI